MMRSMIFLLAALGCSDQWSPGRPITPVLHASAPESWSDGWRDKVAEAADRWNSVLCFDVFVVGEDGAPFTLFARDAWPHYPQTIGFTPADEVHVRGPVPEDELGLLVDVLMHEMGHLMTLQHSVEPDSIMRTRTSGVLVPSEADIRGALEAVGCASR